MHVDLATLGDLVLASTAFATLAGLMLLQVREGPLIRRRFRSKR